MCGSYFSALHLLNWRDRDDITLSSSLFRSPSTAKMEAKRPEEPPRAAEQTEPRVPNPDGSTSATPNPPAPPVPQQHGATPADRAAVTSPEELNSPDPPAVAPPAASAMAHHVEASRDDWSRSILRFVFVYGPEQELEGKLKKALQNHQELEKEFFAGEKSGQEQGSESHGDEVRAFLKHRRALIEGLLSAKSESASWSFPTEVEAAVAMRGADATATDLGERLESFLSAARDLGPTRVGSFRWHETGAGEFSSPHVGFDACSAVLCCALLSACLASRAARAKVAGVAGPKPMLKLSFDLLRRASGLASYGADLGEISKLERIFLPGRSKDCSAPKLRLLSTCFLRDAKQISVAVAIDKGSSHRVVSALATDSMLLPATEEGEGEKNREGKWGAYASWKAQVSRSLGLCFQALHELSREEGGVAKLCSARALDEYLENGSRDRDRFDGAVPGTVREDHRGYDEGCLKFFTDTARKCERENAMVHFKSVPPELPPPIRRDLPEIAAHAPQSLPPAKDCVVEIPPDASEESEEKRRSCCGTCAVVIAMPLLILLSVLGAVVWVLLLPLKLIPCCCPVACALQALWDAVDLMLRAPLHACVWAGGG